MSATARFRWVAILLALGGPLAGLGAYLAGRDRARESVLAYLPVTGSDRAVTLGTEVLLGYELVLGLVLVTQAWRREKDLRRRNELMGAVIQSVTEGVVVADTRGRFVAVNEAARRIVGSGAGREVPPAEWSGHYGLHLPGSDTLFPPDQLPLARAIKGECVEETEVLVRSPRVPAGVWASVTAAPIRDPEGRLLGGVTVFRDITEKKRAEELSQRLSNAVEQTADGVFITDRAGTIEYVNPAFEAITGFSRGEALGRTPRLLKSGRQSPEFYRGLWASLLEGRPFKASVINRKKSGELFIAEQTITPMRDSRSGALTHFVAVLRDLTDRLKLEEQGAELSLAASVQQRLFPTTSPAIHGWDVAGAFSPALATCGDYFDFMKLPDGRLLFAVADVCGHGMGPALIMAATRGYLRSLARTGMPIDEIVRDLNLLLLDDLDERHFVTMVVGFLETTSGAVTWANMGHPTGFVLDRGGRVKLPLASTCKPLGLFQDIGCSLGPPLVMDAGDAIVLLTDGAIETESPDGRQHGTEAVLGVVRSNLHRPSEEIVRQVIQATRDHAQGVAQEDDVTAVVIKRTA